MTASRFTTNALALSDFLKGQKAIELVESIAERYAKAACPLCGAEAMTTHRDPDCFVAEAQRIAGPLR